MMEQASCTHHHRHFCKDQRVNPPLLDWYCCSSQAQDRHQQAQPQVLVHAEVSMTRPLSWPKPQENQLEQNDSSQSHLRSMSG